MGRTGFSGQRWQFSSGSWRRRGQQPKPVSPTTKPAGGHLFAPYSKMNTLSDDQREQIETIHRKALADVKEIEAKETTDIIALLSDDQEEGELREIEDKTSADRKTRRRRCEDG